MWQLALAIGASTAVSYMGSLQQSKQLKAAAAWDQYHLNIRKMQDTIMANERAAKLLSEKRAAIGARGITFEGSSLLEQNAVVENLEDTLFWINKGAEMTAREIDYRLGSKLQATAWNAGTSLLSNLGSSYITSKMSLNQSSSPLGGDYSMGHT